MAPGAVRVLQSSLSQHLTPLMNPMMSLNLMMNLSLSLLLLNKPGCLIVM